MQALRNPKPNTSFGIINRRLALYHASNDHGAYWNQYWPASRVKSLLTRGQEGVLFEYEVPIIKHAARDSIVLEAGCGPGHLVAALNKRGFRAIGVEYDSTVVKMATQFMPDLDIHVGDVLRLGLADNSIGTYLSLGVVEHFVDGPKAALVEARRVLQDDGRALISVPYLNPARDMLRRQLRPGCSTSELHFHQYYYSHYEFSCLLREAGFRVLETYPYAVFAHLTREHIAVSTLWQSSVVPYRFKSKFHKWLDRSPMWARRRYGHMIMFVCAAV